MLAALSLPLHRADPARPSPLARAVMMAAAAVAIPLRCYRNRRVQEAMAGMSAHELADIGLTRQDLADATALPLGSEAGAFLAGRVRHRRHRSAD